MTELRIGHRVIGPGRPVYFIAEAGSNHNCDLQQARRLIEVAAEAGADAVKFQTFRADRLYPKSAGMTDYLGDPRSIHSIIRDLEMPLDWIPELANHARHHKLDFLSTPFDLEAVAVLEPHVPAFKVASYEMTYHGLVQQCVRTKKPLIVSTGTATLDEVREMVAAARAAGCKDLIVMQCTAKYPAPLSALNLRTLTTMAQDLDVLVGFSDHSREGFIGPLGAVALGACMIEKHFTLSNRLPGPDHAYALEPDELAEVIRHVRELEAALGSGEKKPAPEEMELRSFARRSVYTTRALAKGEALTTDNTAVLRAGKLAHGIHPADYLFVMGRRATVPLVEEAPIVEASLAPLSLSHDDVTLRPLGASDAEDVVRWRNRPDVAEQFFAERGPTLAEHNQWFQSLRTRGDRLEFAILQGGRAVGTIGLSQIDLGKKTASYGVLIGEEAARGKGAAESASRALLDFAFTTLGLGTVTLSLYSDNVAAKKLYDKLGFAQTGPADSRTRAGKPRAVTHMTIKAPAKSPG